MKYIKLFENFSESELERKLKKYGIKNYTINEDGTIDVNGDVFLNNKKLHNIPFKFGKVNSFICSNNKLTSLEGSPTEIVDTFECSNNILTSLEGSPKEVGGHFYCFNNKLVNLKGSPEEVGGDFNCFGNNLNTLEGMPLEIGGNFHCRSNPNLVLLNSLSNIEGIIYCDKHIDTSKFKGYCKEIIKKYN